MRTMEQKLDAIAKLDATSVKTAVVATAPDSETPAEDVEVLESALTAKGRSLNVASVTVYKGKMADGNPVYAIFAGTPPFQPIGLGIANGGETPEQVTFNPLRRASIPPASEVQTKTVAVI